MQKELTSTEAGELYDTLGRGSWRADSLTGTCLAVENELGEHLAGALHKERRRANGLSAGKNEPLADWVLFALPDYLYVAQQLRPSLGFLSVATDPDFLRFFAELCQTGSVGRWFRTLDDQRRGEIEALVDRMRERMVPARRSALQAFYFGVRVQFYQQGFGEPKPSEIRLLAAARGIAPISLGLDHARKQWEDRVRRWKRDLDGRWPAVCAALDEHAAMTHGGAPPVIARVESAHTP